MKVICYGDSNTYGFDPRTGSSGRLARHERWTGILDSEPGIDIVNEGMNGRCIPTSDCEYRSLKSILAANSDADVIVIMLGTNDLFMIREATAEKIADKMRGVFQNVPELGEFAKSPGRRVLLICPPAPSTNVLFFSMMGIEAEQTADVAARIMRELPRALYKVANENEVEFANAAAWNIECMFDGIHFSEEGHRRFARKMLKVLKKETK